MKQLLVTHIDLDGAGCAVLFKRYYPDIEVQYCDYDTIDEVSEKIWNTKDEYDAIYFADITPNEEYGMKMLGDSKFMLIDHHATRLYLKHANSDQVVYDTEFCATCLVANYLGTSVMSHEEYRAFVLGVDAYDTWKLDSLYRTYGVDLNLLFNYYGMDTFVKQFGDMQCISDKEYEMLEIFHKIEADYLAEKLEQGRIRFDKEGNMYFEIYVSEKGSNIGMLIDDPGFPEECEYIKAINLNDRVVGLYSKTFDVSQVAAMHGGGGHRTAAGYEISFLQPIYV